MRSAEPAGRRNYDYQKFFIPSVALISMARSAKGGLVFMDIVYNPLGPIEQFIQALGWIWTVGLVSVDNVVLNSSKLSVAILEH